MHEAAKGSIQITAFFQSAKNKSQEDEQDIEEVPELRIPTFTETVEKALELLRPMTTQVCNQRVENRMRDISKYDFVRLMAVKRYLYRIQSNQESHVCASNQIASELYPDSNTEWKARSIRKWASYFLMHQSLPELNQGKHQKVSSLIDCEDVRSECLIWLRQTNPNLINGRSFSVWVTSHLHLRLEYPDPVKLSSRQATKWLNKLGYEYRQHKQSHNVDGHERADVVAYRKKFLRPHGAV